MKRIKEAALLMISVSAAVFMIMEGGICADGVKEGVDVCLETLIPTLFPFMVLSKLIVSSGALDICGRLLSRPFAFLFRLPPDAVPAVIISFIGGFPVGAALADGLYRDGRINRTQLEIMLSFCVCGGPAFLIGAVGERLFGNPLCGVVIYLSVILAAAVVGFCTCRMLKAEPPERNRARSVGHLPFTSCLVSSVEEGARGMLVICSFVLLFSAVNNVIFSLIPRHNISDALSFTLEVTGGVGIAAEHYGLPAAAFICSFSGLAVICQILAMISEKIHTLRFFVCRVCAGGLSYAFCRLLMGFFPAAKPVYKNFSEIRADLSGEGILLPCFLLLLSVVFLLSLGRDNSGSLDFTCDI